MGPWPGTGSIDSMLCFHVDGGQVLFSRPTGHVDPSTHFSGDRVYQDMAVCRVYVFEPSYFGGCAGWFSLVGGTIPFSRR